MNDSLRKQGPQRRRPPVLRVNAGNRQNGSSGNAHRKASLRDSDRKHNKDARSNSEHVRDVALFSLATVARTCFDGIAWTRSSPTSN